MDLITLQRIQQAHPKIRTELNQVYNEICIALSGRAICRFSFVLRTFAEQTALYNKRPKVTNAKAGQSFHNYGLAVDIVLIIDGKEISYNMLKDYDGDRMADWMECVAIFKKHGYEWGGDWKKLKDNPHFQKTFGYSWQKLLELHNAGKVDKNGYVII